MNRREFYQKLWLDCKGILKSGERVAVAGGGVSGLQLSLALRRRGVDVSLFECARVGGVRIALMKACHTSRPNVFLWSAAQEFSAAWYKTKIREGFAVSELSAKGASYFVVKTRAYIRALERDFHECGGVLYRKTFQKADARNFSLWFAATGAALWSNEFRFAQTATQRLFGRQTYMANAALREPTQGIEFLQFNTRAAFIHRRDDSFEETISQAKRLAKASRYAALCDHRLVTRDRLPIVGFTPRTEYANYNEFRHFILHKNFAAEAMENNVPFLFQGMGYHALTYAPFLAEKTAAWLCGEDARDAAQNVLCTLTPVRFLPR